MAKDSNKKAWHGSGPVTPRIGVSPQLGGKCVPLPMPKGKSSKK